MKVTVDLNLRISECKRGHTVPLTEDIKTLINDKIYPRFEPIVECMLIDGRLQDVLVEFDIKDIKTEFNDRGYN